MKELCSEILHVTGQAIMIPCLLVLIALILVAVWQVGDLIVELMMERRRQKCDAPAFLKTLHQAGASGLNGAIEISKLQKGQKAVLKTLINAAGMPKEEMEALAQQLLSDQQAQYDRMTDVTDLVAKLGPMFGLLGTLIPLGPGLIALGQGDTETLSRSMGVAFDTTIAGVITAAVASVISHIRKRWYDADMMVLETAMECILKEIELHAEEKRIAGAA